MSRPHSMYLREDGRHQGWEMVCVGCARGGRGTGQGVPCIRQCKVSRVVPLTSLGSMGHRGVILRVVSQGWWVQLLSEVVGTWCELDAPGTGLYQIRPVGLTTLSCRGVTLGQTGSDAARRRDTAQAKLHMNRQAAMHWSWAFRPTWWENARHRPRGSR